MNEKMLERFCPLDAGCKSLMEHLINSLGLSARAYSRIIKVARTIADLAGSQNIMPAHLREAAGYRFLDRAKD
jgi:magnesium chelatase family protein